MKNILLSFLILFISLPLISQVQVVELPDHDPEPQKTDFYIRDVAYKLTTGDTLGTYTTGAGEKTAIGLGQTPDEKIKNFLQAKYPPADDKTALIISVVELSLSESISSTGEASYKADAKLRFHILNGDMLVILGTGTGSARKKAAEGFDFGGLIAESLDWAVIEFNSTNWRDHPLLTTKPEKDKSTESRSSDLPRQKDVYTLQPQRRSNLNNAKNSNQIDFSFGYSYRLGKIPENATEKQKELIEGLIHGINFHASYTTFFDNQWGLGLLFNYSIAQSYVADFPILDNNNQVFYMDVEETISVGFIGPLFGIRREPNRDNKINFQAGLGLGYVFYLDEINLQGNFIDATGKTVGFAGNASLNLFISSSSYIMLRTGFMVASLGKMEIAGSSYYMEENENLSRMDLNVGIGFNF